MVSVPGFAVTFSRLRPSPDNLLGLMEATSNRACGKAHAAERTKLIATILEIMSRRKTIKGVYYYKRSWGGRVGDNTGRATMPLKQSVTLLAFAASGLFAQSPPTRPKFDAFEVATIKPAVVSPGRYIRMQSVNRFYAKDMTLNAMIAAAYSLTPRAISGGPPWTDADRYDILASTPGGIQPSLDEQMGMLRKLLSDRFQLAFHREPRELPVFAL